MATAFHFAFARWHPVWIGLIVLLTALLLVLGLLLANPAWLAGPLQRAVASHLHREFRIGGIHVLWSPRPTIELNDVVVGNIAGASEPQMARIRSMRMQLSLSDLLRGRIFVSEATVSDVEVLLERYSDGRANWIFTGDTNAKPQQQQSRLRVGAVSLVHGRIRYVDQSIPMDATVQVQPLHGRNAATSERSKAQTTDNDHYAARFDISGHYRGNPFSGHAASGRVLSLQDSGVPFPLQLTLTAGETQLQMEGTIADALQLSGVDMRIQIAGPTLANIYPLLLLPLPASPPYALHGRLRRDGGRFAIDDLGGRIGSTDLEGEGSYVVREPRPILRVELRSQLLNVTDLGPLIGVETKSRTGRPLSQDELSSRERASETDKSLRGERVLPAGHFDPERLRVIDADVRLRAQHLKGVSTVPLENFDAVMRLRNAVLQLDSLKVAAAGGTVVGQATLDARQGSTLHSKMHVEMRSLHLDQLVPKNSPLAKGAGRIDVHATLSGSGNSIADAAAKADGRIAATTYEGRISNLVDAASSLAIGRVLALLVTGDRDIKLNCGAAVFDVEHGQGKSSLFVLDTAKTQVLGSGQFDLAQERFTLHVEPKPKTKGLLSLRTPVDLKGSFSHAELSLEKKPLVARAGVALALGAIAPPAALLALIETGPGEDTPCAEVLREAAGAKAQTKAATADAR